MSTRRAKIGENWRAVLPRKIKRVGRGQALPRKIKRVRFQAQAEENAAPAVAEKKEDDALAVSELAAAPADKQTAAEGASAHAPGASGTRALTCKDDAFQVRGRGRY
jgi:hypothetical protein